jgi:1-phosphofructokinase family hexose kinase
MSNEILALCLNPSKDTYCDYINAVFYNSVVSRKEVFAGKGINFARSSQAIGRETLVLGFLPDKSTGFASTEIGDLPTKLIETPGALRENFKFISEKKEVTEFHEGSTEVSAEALEKFLTAYKAALAGEKLEMVAMCGSLPKGVSDDFYHELANMLPQDIKFVADTSGVRLLSLLDAGPVLVKPNKPEFEDIFKTEFSALGDMAAACRTLINKGAQNVLMSLGADGAVISNGSQAYYAKCECPAPLNTVGAGDVMLAAAADIILKGGNNREVLRHAVAASVYKVATMSPYIEDSGYIKEYLPKVKVEEIL